jgi:hypothetical protein
MAEVGDDNIPCPFGELEPFPVLREGETSVPGRELPDRAKALNCWFGQHQAEELLAASRGFPAGWNEFTFVFTGTVWASRGEWSRPRSGPEVIPCLFCCEQVWGMEWGIVLRELGDNPFDEYDYFMRVPPTAKLLPEADYFAGY